MSKLQNSINVPAPFTVANGGLPADITGLDSVEIGTIEIFGNTVFSTSGLLGINSASELDLTAQDGLMTLTTSNNPIVFHANSSYIQNTSGFLDNIRIMSNSDFPSNTYTMVQSDRFISVNLMTVGVTVKLPATPNVGQSLQIMDGNGNSGLYNITIDGNGENINGSGSIIINTPFQNIRVTYNGERWLSW